MDYIKKCEQCDTKFSSQRADVRFCSDGCRKKLSRTQELVKSDNIDIGYGPNDYTREMVEQRLRDNPEDKFIPNWYLMEEGFLSKNHYKSLAWK